MASPPAVRSASGPRIAAGATPRSLPIHTFSALSALTVKQGFLTIYEFKKNKNGKQLLRSC
ncbi:MAG: hypothetical protein AAF361_14560, partial [Bacteroidota bacterium]